MIELDRAPDFDVRSYDGKVTVYFKVLLRDLSPKWIRYCRMHGSGKLHTCKCLLMVMTSIEFFSFRS